MNFVFVVVVLLHDIGEPDEMEPLHHGGLRDEGIRRGMDDQDPGVGQLVADLWRGRGRTAGLEKNKTVSMRWPSLNKWLIYL